MGRLGQQMRTWGGVALKNPLAFLITFALGGSLTFAYSYVPLHTVKMQKIDRLQGAVLEQETELAGLADEIERLQSAADGGLDAFAAESLQAEGEAAREENDSLRREVDRAKQRTKRLERERAEWRRRVAALEQRLEVATTKLAESRPAATPAPAPQEPAPMMGAAAGTPSGGPPSAPAP